MTENSATPSTGRPSRLQVPTLVGGLLIGALIMGAVAPLVGSDRRASVSTDAPEFLAGEEGTGAGGAEGTGGGSEGLDGASSGSAIGGPSGSGGSGGSGGSTGVGATASSGQTANGESPVERVASDIGITSDSILIGSITTQCNNCAAFGFTLSSSVSHAQMSKAYADEINERGGIHGRKLVVYTKDYDPAADGASGGGQEREACIELTERRKVFAVIIGGFNTNACVYEEHKTPLITHADPHADDPESFNRNDGRLWMYAASSARVLLDFARQIDLQQIIPKTAKWGVVYSEDEGTGAKVQKHFLSEMKRRGYTPTHETRVPVDPGTAPVKIAQDTAAMQAKGITHVVLADNFVYSAAWVRAAQSNDWKPQYVVSEFPNGANDFTGGVYDSTGGWTGAIAIANSSGTSVAEARKQEPTKSCMDYVEKKYDAEPGSVDQSWATNYCMGYRLFEQAMNRAGPNPTRRSFVQAMATTGEFPYPGAIEGKIRFGGAYAFGPALWSGMFTAQRKVWRSPCPDPTDNDDKCWVAVAPPFRMTT